MVAIGILHLVSRDHGLSLLSLREHVLGNAVAARVLGDVAFAKHPGLIAKESAPDPYDPVRSWNRAGSHPRSDPASCTTGRCCGQPPRSAFGLTLAFAAERRYVRQSA
jgi:hypothetical protein